MKLKNKILTITLSALIFVAQITAHAQIRSTSDFFNTANGKIDVNVNGDYLDFDVEPIMKNDCVMVPMRDIFEKLGAEISWNQNTKTVTAQKGSDIIALTIGNSNLNINGRNTTLDAPAMLYADKTLVPVRAVSEAFGASVSWFGYDESIVTISTYPVSTQDAIDIVRQIGNDQNRKVEVRDICCYDYRSYPNKGQGPICYHVRADHWMYDEEYEWPLSTSYYVNVTDGTIEGAAG